MLRNYKRSLVMSTSALAIALAAPSAGWAQEGQQAQNINRLEEITVTARRIEENIQKVPMAVLAFNEEKLQTQNIINFKDFQKITPAFSTVIDDGSFSFMRGLAGIVTFFADAPIISRATGQYFDVGNVQVLKGPQGTLFAASSAAGAFVINPKRPGNVLEGFVSTTVGDYGRRTVEGAVSIPIVEDKLLFRIAAQSWYRKGYVTDVDTGEDYYDENYYVVRPSFIIKPTENIESYTMLHYFYERNNGRITYVTDINPFGVYQARVGAARSDVILSQNKANPYELHGLNQAQGYSGDRRRQFFIVNNTRWDITDDIALINIFSWRKEGGRNYVDAVNDGYTGVRANDPRAIATRTGPLTMQEVWSNETKFQGNLFEDRIKYTVGTFHTANPTKGEISWGNTLNILTANVTKGDTRNPARVRAVFGQADFDASDYLLDGLIFTAGYRYTWNTVRSFRTDYRVLPGVPTSQLQSSRDLYGVAHFSDDNWLFSARWEMDNDTMFYVTGVKGVTTGQVAPANPAPFKTTNPEKLVQIEGGVKSTFFLGDIQFRTNASVYYGWYSDIQSITTRFVQVAPPPAPPATLVISENSAEGLVRGFDAELTIVPTEWLEFNWNGAFNKNKYTFWPIYNAAGVQIENRKRPFIGVPRFKWNLTGTIHVPMDEANGQVSISATFSHTSRNWYFAGSEERFDTVNHTSTHTAANGYGPLSADGALAPRDYVNPFHNLDMDVSWKNAAGVDGLSATLSIVNVLKNKHGWGQGYTWFSGGTISEEPTPPRMFTVSLKYSF